MLGFYKEKSGAAKGAAEGIQRTTHNAIDEASSYSTIPAEKVVGQLLLIMDTVCSCIQS